MNPRRRRPEPTGTVPEPTTPRVPRHLVVWVLLRILEALGDWFA